MNLYILCTVESYFLVIMMMNLFEAALFQHNFTDINQNEVYVRLY